MTNNGAPLDARIADALANPDQSSDFFAALIAEVDEAIDHSDRTSREGRAASIDPARLDGIAQRARAEDAEFVSHRLRAGLERLKQLLGAAVTREAQACWETEAGELRKEVDEIAAYFKRVYSETAGHLVGVLEKMAAIDQKVDALNSRAPAGVNWLRRTEATARGISKVNGKPIVMQIALPKLLGFDYPEKAPLAWPPVAVNHALEYYHAVSAAITHAPPPPTDAERIAASERQMQFVAEQERGRERLAAETARAAAGR
jgi:hypothetical protein